MHIDRYLRDVFINPAAGLITTSMALDNQGQLSLEPCHFFRTLGTISDILYPCLPSENLPPPFLMAMTSSSHSIHTFLAHVGLHPSTHFFVGFTVSSVDDDVNVTDVLNNGLQLPPPSIPSTPVAQVYTNETSVQAALLCYGIDLVAVKNELGSRPSKNPGRKGSDLAHILREYQGVNRVLIQLGLEHTSGYPGLNNFYPNVITAANILEFFGISQTMWRKRTYAIQLAQKIAKATWNGPKSGSEWVLWHKLKSIFGYGGLWDDNLQGCEKIELNQAALFALSMKNFE
ncbi:hypothetical protein CYLTODRAFT_447857, partial [Cylindrobasidium torrendii FP15055 ss-10]